MDYLRGYKVFREDPQWTNKLLVAALLALSTAIVPLAGQLVLSGWTTLLTRRAVHGQITEQPRLDFDLDYLGKLLGIGFKSFLVQFLWGLPAAVLGLGLFGCVWAGAIASAGSGDGSGPGPMLCVTLVGGTLIALPLMILLTLPAQCAALRTELTDDLGEGLKFREVMDMTKALFRPLLVGSLVLGSVAVGLALLGMVLCYIGLFAVVPVILVSYAHFHAQLYERWLAIGGAPLPKMGPLDVAPPTPPAAPPMTFGGV